MEDVPDMARSRQHAGAAILALALGAIVLFGASPAPPAASPGPSGSAPAPGTLQGLVDAARPGAVVDVPAGVYRESVTIDKPLTVRGEGAEIRGSDVWSDWQATGSRWRSNASVPPSQAADSAWTRGAPGPSRSSSTASLSSRSPGTRRPASSRWSPTDGSCWATTRVVGSSR